MFKRKAYNELLKWKETTKGSKAILIEGARRIGKSTLVKEFIKNNYKSSILIDFSKVDNEIKDAFNNSLNDLDSLFMILSLKYKTNLYKRESVIVFDEVQRFPRAREAIKHLVADGRYDYIETGSLISIKENVENILIPSEERSISMYPMDFEEFLWAMGEDIVLNYIKECFKNKKPLLDPIHKKAMFLLKQYILVGGMPKAVDEFIKNNKQFYQCEEEKKDIIKNYRDDIHKIKNTYKTKVLSVFDHIPSFLSSHEKRVRINSLSSDSSGLDYEETFFWLEESMICNMCFLTTDPNVGLSLNEKRTFVKCYMGDTGLLITHTINENSKDDTNYHISLLTDKFSINKGMFFENLVAQMLTSNGHKLYFYTKYNETKHRNDIEIDFLLTSGSKVSQKLIPIEVKSSKSYKTNSLEAFNKKYKKRIDVSYIIHPKNLKVREDGIICLPIYMCFCL